MKQEEARVVSVTRVSGGFERPGGRSIVSTCLITLSCPEIAEEVRPGQFVMVNCGEGTLPRPFSINRVTNEGELCLYFAVLENGAGTSWLAQRKEGETVKVLGPLGNGFTVGDTSHNILLVAGGIGIAPLVFLAEESLKKGIGVTLLYGTPGGGRLPVESLLPDANVVIATEDGSEGFHGLATDLLPAHINTTDRVFICGPEAMYRYLRDNADRLLKRKPAQVSLEARMACGRGVCYGCTILTGQGTRRVCEDGPVFDLYDTSSEYLA